MFFKHEVDDSRYQKSVQSTSLLPTLHGLLEGPLFDLKMIFLFLSGKLQDLTSIAYGRINLIGTICCWEPKNSEGTVKRGKTVEKNWFKKDYLNQDFLGKTHQIYTTVFLCGADLSANGPILGWRAGKDSFL